MNVLSIEDVAARSLMLLAVLGACAGTLPDGSLHHANRMLLGAAVLTTACDLGSTRRAAIDHWRTNKENNRILGTTPLPGSVDAYAALAIAGTAVIGLMLPPRLRTIFLAAVTVVEGHEVLRSYNKVEGVCGLPAPSVQGDHGPGM